MIAELLSFRVRTRTKNKNSKECAYTPDNPYTLTRQNNVHNSLRIELEPIFQTFTIDGYKMGTNAYIIECIYLVILLLEMSVALVYFTEIAQKK